MLTLLTIIFATLPASAQSTLTVANGSDTSEFIPVYGYYADTYLRSQTIYPASMLSSMNGSAITSMVFYFSTVPEYDWGSTFIVKLTEVSDSAFSSTEFMPTSNAVTVFTGILYELGGQMLVDFDAPYNYSGGNLLMEITTLSPYDYSESSFYGIASMNSSLYKYNYYQVPGDNAVAEIEHFIPKTTFHYGTANPCVIPTMLYASNIGSYDATIHWTGDSHVSSYIFQYMLASQTDWDNDAIEQTVTDTSILLTNMLPAATYQCRVKAVCSATDTSYWSSIFAFSTLSLPVTPPYTQDFETSPDSITDFYFTYSGPNRWCIGDATYVPGAVFGVGHSLYISNSNGDYNTYDSTVTAFAYATMNVNFDNSPLEWHLAFDYKSNGEPSWDFFAVYLLDDTTDVPEEGIPEGTALLAPATGITTWTHYDVVMDSVIGTSKKLVFFWKNDSYSGHNPPAAVDNISITGIVPVIPCTTPSQLTATEIGNDHVTLSWSGDADQYAVYMSGDASGYYTTSDTTIVISGLSGDSEYSFQVRSLCGTDSSELTPALNVTTLSDPVEPCEMPTGLSAGESLDTGGDHSIMLTWVYDENVTLWNVQYKKENEDWITETVNVNSYQINNVITDVPYYARVQAVCGDENTSDWSDTVGFMITGINEHLQNCISLSPNPANDVVNVQCTMNNVQVKAMEVFDVYGKLIRTVETVYTPSLQTQINVAGLASGMYFVRVTTEAGTVTKSFVKR